MGGVVRGGAGVLFRLCEIGPRIRRVWEGTRRESRQLTCMTISEGNRDAARRKRLESVDWIRGEARFRLLAIRDHRRPRLFEPADRIADSAVVQLPHVVLSDSARGELLHACDEIGGPGNASDGFCRYCHEA